MLNVGRLKPKNKQPSEHHCSCFRWFADNNRLGNCTFTGWTDWTLYVNEPGPFTASRMSSLRSVLAFGSMLGAVALGFGMWAMIAPAEDKHQTLIKVIQPN